MRATNPGELVGLVDDRSQAVCPGWPTTNLATQANHLGAKNLNCHQVRWHDSPSLFFQVLPKLFEDRRTKKNNKESRGSNNFPDGVLPESKALSHKINYRQLKTIITIIYRTR